MNLNTASFSDDKSFKIVIVSLGRTESAKFMQKIERYHLRKYCTNSETAQNCSGYFWTDPSLYAPVIVRPDSNLNI